MMLVVVKFLLGIVAAVSGLIVTVLLVYLGPNILYFIRGLFSLRNPIGRQPTKKSRILWLYFGICGLTTIVSSSLVGSLPDTFPSTALQITPSSPTLMPSFQNFNLQGIPTYTPTLTPLSTETITSTPSSSPTAPMAPIPTLDIADQLVSLIDMYYSCLNSASPNDGNDSDYEACWNLLSNHPGEYQSVTDKKNFYNNWKKYKISYALFFCSKNYNNSVQYFVHVRYYLYNRNDDSVPIENGTQYYAEYVFAHDDQGWRIKGANFDLDDIGSFCENDPRINKLDISP